MGPASPALSRSSVSPSFTAVIAIDRFSLPRDSRSVVVPPALHDLSDVTVLTRRVLLMNENSMRKSPRVRTRARARAMAATSRESKRRRVSHVPVDDRTSFAGTNLAELLEHLASVAPSVRVSPLDALGAEVSDRTQPALDDATEALACEVPGSFVARVENMFGASKIGDLGALAEGDGAAGTAGDGVGDGAGTNDGDRAPRVTILTCAMGDDGAAAGSRHSRAHELLTIRAREVFDAALANEPGNGGKATGGDGGIDASRAIESLVLWLDDHADVFTAGDASNGGRIMAPDPEAGGVLVPSRLLG